MAAVGVYPREGARRLALEEIDRLRAEIGPVRGVTVEELLADEGE